MLSSVLALVIGASLLLGGAELFTENAPGAARALGISVFAVGLLLAGAEPEELFTAAIAAAKGSPGIAFGDAVGSNITITTLALGAAATIAPLRVEASARRLALAALVFSLPAALFAFWGAIERLAGVFLVGLFAIYLGFVLRREFIAKVSEGQRQPSHWLALGLCLLGLVATGIGGNFTVDGAMGLAAWLGTRESTIGLSIVAFATSVEMLFLAIVPALRGRPELSLGAVLGSYVFNATLTLGGAALVHPLFLPRFTLAAPAALMWGSLILFLAFVRGGGALWRWQGIALMAVYVSYLLSLGLRETIW
ncbi:MAG: hypothetical protein HYX89_04305 [Chloroflexi bacterium]|nr:hypothetical protein [Chloroflexota bacterium]